MRESGQRLRDRLKKKIIDREEPFNPDDPNLKDKLKKFFESASFDVSLDDNNYDIYLKMDEDEKTSFMNNLKDNILKEYKLPNCKINILNKNNKTEDIKEIKY
jgi:hypothetical protein